MNKRIYHFSSTNAYINIKSTIIHVSLQSKLYSDERGNNNH